jgi:hypothetical protein
MICSSCGVRNVDFASTCFSCRQPLGKLEALATPAPSSEERQTRRRVAPRGGAASPGGAFGALVRLALVAAAIAWVVGRGFLHRESQRTESPETGPPAEVAKEAPQRPAAETAAPAPEAVEAEEQNGFRLVHFEWGPPSAGPDGSFRTGETVTGRSEIQGFGVTEDQKINVTVALAFRDPTGKLVEPISPNVVRQPKESETLYTSFDYAIPAGAPAGTYDLELAIDDAVSARSARFHRNISVEAAKAR